MKIEPQMKKILQLMKNIEDFQFLTKMVHYYNQRRVDFTIKSGEESLTQDQIDYFISQRKQHQEPLKSTQLQSQLNQLTPQKVDHSLKDTTTEQKKTNPLTQKSPQHKLSKETLQIMKRVRDVNIIKIPIQDNQIISKILSRPSLRDRFQNLETITTTRDLLLHSKYKNLVQKFEQIDQMILFMRLKKQTPFWNQIQKNLYEASKSSITLNIIQCIISVWPQSYVLSWMINDKLIRLDKYDIVVQLSQAIIPEKRVDEFKLKLLNYIQSHGEHIEEAELPARPDKKQAETIKEYIEKSEQIQPPIEPKSQRAYDILKRITDINKTQQPSTSINLTRFSNNPNFKQENSRISQALLDKVMEKEQKLKESLAHSVNNDKPASKDYLIMIANILYNYYLTRQVSNMFLINVVSYVKNNNKRFILSDAQIMDNITQLSNIIPTWVKIVENKNGSILRLDKSIELPTVLKEIDNYTQLKEE